MISLKSLGGIPSAAIIRHRESVSPESKAEAKSTKHITVASWKLQRCSSGGRSDDRSGNRIRLPLRAICVKTRLALAYIAGFGEVTEPGVTGLEVGNDGVGFKEVGCLERR